MSPFASVRLPPRYVLVSMLCSFGGFLFGMDTGIIGPVTVMKSYTNEFGTQSATIHGLIVSAILIPAAFSAFFAGKLADVFGRPRAIAIGTLIVALGTALMAGAVHIAMFAVGRCIEGIGEGLYLGNLVVYICEISPPSQRGPLTTGPQLMITLGLLAGFFTCYGSDNINSSLAWRTPFLILSCLAMIFSVSSALWLVESPRWLTLRGRHADAAATWDLLGVLAADREKAEIEEDITEPQLAEIVQIRSVGVTAPVLPLQRKDRVSVQNTPEKARGHSFMDVFRKDVRMRTLFAVFLMGMQQLSGIDGVLYYAPLLFQQAGLASSQSSFLASGVSAILIFVFTVPALFYSDKWGRRHSIIYGGIGLIIPLFLIGSLYASGTVHSTGPSRWIVIISIYIFAVVYAISWAIGIKICAAEIQPQRTRASATSLAHGSNWVANFLVALTTPILLAKSSYGAYFLWGGCTVVTVIVCALWMPETKGKSLDEIERVFRERKGFTRRSGS